MELRVKSWLRHNPGYVFFRVIRNVSPEKGPLGAMNRPLTTLRSAAVDPRLRPSGGTGLD